MFRNGNFDSYNNRLVHRLACNIFRCYKLKDTDTGYTLECRPFNCYHYYHDECLESWKEFHMNKNKGIAKTIRCSLCQSNVREMYGNLYAYEWKVYGSRSTLSPDARIEVIDIEDSVDVEVTDTPNTPNFKERQSIAITRYNNLLRADQESYQNYMKNNKIMNQVPENQCQSWRISMEPDRYGQNNLTVKHLLFPKNVNVSSAMSVPTIDNMLRVNK